MCHRRRLVPDERRWPVGVLVVRPEGDVPAARHRRPHPYPRGRKRQTAAYSWRHYGVARWRLRKPRVIVLHFTGGNRYISAWNHFASNAPARGELPGVCTHYIAGRDGVLHEVVPPTIRCRHTIGLNHVSIGIEMVQRLGRGSHWAARRVLRRRRQIRPVLRLVLWRQRRCGIRARDVIGHAMANDSRYFRDLQGWRNDHSDWLRREVRSPMNRRSSAAGRRQPPNAPPVPAFAVAGKT